MWSAISTNEQLAERIRVRSTAVQVTVLRSRSEPARILCVANTHLYFHPDADHIRLLQFAAAFRYVQSVRERIVADAAIGTTAANVSLVFAGDFNSTPECGVFKLMTEKRVPKDFVDFRSSEYCLVGFCRKRFGCRVAERSYSYSILLCIFQNWSFLLRYTHNSSFRTILFVFAIQIDLLFFRCSGCLLRK